jgi:predicted O-methyltransferase YrrM
VPCAPAKWSSSDEAAVGALGGLVAGLVWTPGAMRPAGLLTVVREVRARGAAHVVECGCGLSTVVLARLAARIGGSLTALEHDAEWTERVRADLTVDGLDAHARVVHAPLAPHPLALTDGGWYEAGAVADALDGVRIDVLLVDGPPAYEPSDALARYPALPAFRAGLAAGAAIVLDDAARAGERWVLARWAGETGLRFALRTDGIAIAGART